MVADSHTVIRALPTQGTGHVSREKGPGRDTGSPVTPTAPLTEATNGLP